MYLKNTPIWGVFLMGYKYLYNIYPVNNDIIYYRGDLT
jgi:hypothetical protein